MKKQVYNPYLPLYEYVPDGEPHLFNGRVYVYGSHDKFGAFNFCQNNYITYSASEDDLSDWRYEGEILDKREDPINKKGRMCLFAPDVTRGVDGKYYIYYSYDFCGVIGVACCDTPNGTFKYVGHVHYKDGTVLSKRKGDRFQFDPGVLVDDDNRVYLYSGFGPDHFFPQIPLGLKADGCYCIELESDMVTIKRDPVKVMDKKGIAKDESVGHEFFEASSIRKINGLYFLVYSSINGHELCYATSESPFGPFKFRGTIISNGDVYLNGRKFEDACFPLGNNHGGLVKVKDQWYIFYHRHTNFTNTDRQGLAQRVTIDDTGFIPQVEMTSCGLNDGPLSGHFEYPASICCYLRPKEGNIFYPFFALPHQKGKLKITQSDDDSSTKESQYIANIQNGSMFGYKYFDLSSTSKVSLKVNGKAKGKLYLRFKEDGENIYCKDIDLNTKEKEVISIDIEKRTSNEALYIKFEGKGKFNCYSLLLD